MIKIKHRVNKTIDLKNTDSNLGIEVDIRSNGKNLIIHHDPFEKGEYFQEWLVHYKHKMLILNVKEEGLEELLIKLMEKAKIEDYFFLDQSFPFLLRYSKKSKGRSAIRFSEFESIQTVYKLNTICNWVWIDCFSKIPITRKQFNKLKELNFRICIVSPELQGKNPNIEILKMKNLLKKKMIYPDAVCTKYPELW
tara:strand:- start:837 stop:1421 length:585 start_codon:yes stop_codon:yes gene_type:complete